MAYYLQVNTPMEDIMSWGSGWGDGGSSGGGWGGDTGLPSASRNDAVARDIGGGDGRIQREEFETILNEDLGMTGDDPITEEQARGFLVNLGFEEGRADSIVDGMVEEFPDGFTGDEFLDNVYAYDTDDNGLDSDELGNHHEEIAEFGEPRGWG